MGINHDLFDIAQQSARHQLGEILAGQLREQVGQPRPGVAQLSGDGGAAGKGVGMS